MKRLTGFIKNQLLKVKRLTISGEINIGTSTGFKGNIGEIEQGFTAITEDLKKENRFLKVQCKKELYELTIMLFAYRRIFFDRSFLENLRRQLQSLLDYGSRFEGVTVRLNVYGELHSLVKSEKFRYVNNQTEIIFLNSESSAWSWLPKKLNGKQIGIIVLIVLMLITVGLLVYFDVIPLFPRPLVT